MPTATVISDWFETKSRTEAAIFGVPSLPLVVLRHPVGQLPIPEMIRVTDAALPRVEAALLRGEG